ncbi:ABC-type transporter adrC [Dissostichus eleginoides]|uniref:ABC-type transporter adrC n=1 Tax=Dissostichus eleginoides TaxID=100907 RepID=A0AAD9CRL5_DISEL|nr:ABC-type transporter adrC [Dissostichus eleginoides]
MAVVWLSHNPLAADRCMACTDCNGSCYSDYQRQDRLVNLATISIDSVVVEDLKAAGKFYDIVIDHFATMKDRRMAFLFK